MTNEEVAWLERLDTAIDECWHDLTEWEQMFMEDILGNFHCWGEKTNVSSRQWEIIGRISEKVGL